MYEATTERTRLQKALLLLLAAMAALFAVLTAVFHSQPLARWSDSLLRPSREGDTVLYTGSVRGEDTIIRVSPDGADTVVEFTVGSRLHQTGRITWPEGSIPTLTSGSVPRIEVYLDDQLLFSGGYNAAAGILYREDGSWESSVSASYSAGYSARRDSLILSAHDVVNFAMGPDTVHRGSWGIYACGLFLSGITAVDVAFPRALFYLQHFLSVQDPEPTDLYLAMQKVGWVVLAAAALGIYAWGLTIVS